MNFTETLKQQLLRDMDLWSYHGLHVLKLKIKNAGELCHFNDEYYIRQGTSTEKISNATQRVIQLLSFIKNYVVVQNKNATTPHFEVILIVHNTYKPIYPIKLKAYTLNKGTLLLLNHWDLHVRIPY